MTNEDNTPRNSNDLDIPGSNNIRAVDANGSLDTIAGNDVPPRLVSDNFRGLTAENLGKRFDKRPVVRGVSIAIERGEVVGLLGPNGAGKTTCFYLITGLIQPDYG
ncbi:MAG: ATP-binding cassette domain-containing protein, partial [Rhodospirillaceae bacterium]|nr:ATP-binding cassette domain-containing protein [Rhodospirillaceae bacterium]